MIIASDASQSSQGSDESNTSQTSIKKKIVITGEWQCDKANRPKNAWILLKGKKCGTSGDFDIYCI